MSAGYLIREILLESPEVAGITTKIYPVVADVAIMPYIVYRRTGFTQTAHKSPAPQKADTIQIEVNCYAAGYAGSVELAEAVRTALDGIQATSADGSLRMRSCILEDGDEDIEGDACLQRLLFTIKI